MCVFAGTLDYMAPEVLICPDKRAPDENKDKVLLGYTAQASQRLWMHTHAHERTPFTNVSSCA